MDGWMDGWIGGWTVGWMYFIGPKLCIKQAVFIIPGLYLRRKNLADELFGFMMMKLCTIILLTEASTIKADSALSGDWL